MLAVFGMTAHAKVKDEKVNAGGLNAFSIIQFGKLSFDKAQWKDLQYKTEQEWVAEMAAIEGMFQGFLKDELSKKTVVFAAGKKAGLEVTFSDTKVERGYGFGIGPWGSIATTVTMKDVTTKKVVYQAVLWARKTNTFDMKSQMKSSSETLAEDIAKILSK